MTHLNVWIMATRPRTLPLAFSGILTGTSLAARQVALDYTIAGLTLLTAVLLQILSNFANDYGDAISGVDSEKRKGPIRMVASQSISGVTMKKVLVLFSILTLLVGSLLLFLSFRSNWFLILIFMTLGITSIMAAIKYTVGKNPYGYAGFGDVFVFLFFGIVAVVGSYFLQTKSFDWIIILPASTLGLFSVGVLNINNIRDIESDQLSGKNSIPVRLGRTKAIVYHVALLTLGLLLSILYVIIDFRTWWVFLFLLVIFPLFANIRGVISKPPDLLDPHLRQITLSVLLFSVLFALGQTL